MRRKKAKPKAGKGRHDARSSFSYPKRKVQAENELVETEEKTASVDGTGDQGGGEPETTTGTNKFSVDQILDKVEQYLDEFNYEMARRFCERALQLNPRHIRALEISGAVLLEMDDIENAQQCFGRAIREEPDTGHAKYMYMGQLLTGQDAISSFTKGVAIMNRELEGQQAGSDINGKVTTYDISNAYCSIAEIYLTDECMLENAEDQCRVTLEKAIAANPQNPEAHQLMASFWLSVDNNQEARKSIDLSVSQWLPRLRDADKPDGAELDPIDVCAVPYAARVSCSKILIEVENFDCASEILELLLDEQDEVVEVWYLLGWLNYLQKEEYLSNARFYLTRAKEVAVKTKFEDQDMVAHIVHLLEELGPEPECEDENDGDDIEDSDDENEMEAEVTAPPESMDQ